MSCDQDSDVWRSRVRDSSCPVARFGLFVFIMLKLLKLSIEMLLNFENEIEN